MTQIVVESKFRHHRVCLAKLSQVSSDHGYKVITAIYGYKVKLYSIRFGWSPWQFQRFMSNQLSQLDGYLVIDGKPGVELPIQLVGRLPHQLAILPHQ